MIQGGVNVTGLSVLPLTNVTGAYPLSGATFLDLYSCYSNAADTGRVTNLRAFLNWYFAYNILISSRQVAPVLQNNGFNLLPDSYSTVIRAKYLQRHQRGPHRRGPASGAGTAGGCTGVTGGALLKATDDDLPQHHDPGASIEAPGFFVPDLFSRKRFDSHIVVTGLVPVTSLRDAVSL